MVKITLPRSTWRNCPRKQSWEQVQETVGKSKVKVMVVNGNKRQTHSVCSEERKKTEEHGLNRADTGERTPKNKVNPSFQRREQTQKLGK